MAFPTSSSFNFASRPIHHASLVDPAVHSPALLELIDVELSKQVVGYVIDRVVETVDYAMGRPRPPSSCAGNPQFARFTTFVTNVLARAEVTMPTFLVTLVYIDRVRPRLHIELEYWALERVFLGALVVASKYLNDSTLKNVHWAMCTGLFGKCDLNRIEREYLNVLDFELRITETDLLSHYEGLRGTVPFLFARTAHVPTLPAHASCLPTNPSTNHSKITLKSTPRSSQLGHPAVHVSVVPELSPPSSASSSDSDSPPYLLATPSISAVIDSAVDSLPVKATSFLHDRRSEHMQMLPLPHHTAPTCRMSNLTARPSTMSLPISFFVPS